MSQLAITIIKKLNELQSRRSCPDLKLEKTTVIQIGSRVTNKFVRPDSDFDVVCVSLEKNGAYSFSNEYHGALEIDGALRAAELRSYDLKAFENEIALAPYFFAEAITQGKLIWDGPDAIETVQSIAAQRVERDQELLRTELLSLDVNSMTKLMRIFFTEARNIINCTSTMGQLRLSNSLRLSEYIQDFFEYCLLLNLATKIQNCGNNSVATDDISFLLKLRGRRSGRLLDPIKYDLPSPISDIFAQIQELFHESPTIEGEFENRIFSVFDNAFIKLTGHPLLLNMTHEENAEFINISNGESK